MLSTVLKESMLIFSYFIYLTVLISQITQWLHSKNWRVQFPIGYLELHFAISQEYTLCLGIEKVVGKGVYLRDRNWDLVDYLMVLLLKNA